jgi:transaldolase/glucose-6-phosphate isomerase
MTDSIKKLHGLGQSLWYDNIQRRLLENGELAEMIQRGDIRGVTSNPSIFNNAIAKTNDYDSALRPMAWAGWSAERIYNQLSVEDICAAADLFLPLYRESQGLDGYVSLEVSPYLAKDTSGTIIEAQKLWRQVNRPNLMIKIPATQEGIPAVEATLAAGINVNVTLIFSLERYREVMEAYLRGLEKAAAAGRKIDTIASVASFFVSRVDTKIDPRLDEIGRKDVSLAGEAGQLLGKAAIANARMAYADFQEVFGGARFKKLQESGAKVQRPLWASTSTKNPQYRDVIYVEELIGPDTVDTVPPQTLDAYREHGQAKVTLTQGLSEAKASIQSLEKLGISMQSVTQELEDEGVKSFSDAFTALLKSVETRREKALAELGGLGEQVAQTVARLEEDKFTQRMAGADPTLWTDDPAGKAEVIKRLGWLAAPEKSQELIREAESFVEQLCAEGISRVLLLGMGGSSLAPEVFALMRKEYTAAFSNRPGLELTILDSTDPTQVERSARQNTLGQTLYVVSSKSGSTSEVSAFLDYFWSRAEAKYGDKAGKYFAAITDPDTGLEKIAQLRGFRQIFHGDANVGGRYSALTAFGLIPAALSGLDLKRLLSSAVALERECAPQVPAGRSPGVALGAILGVAAQQGVDKLTVLADPAWEPFGGWLEQLVAESSGKLGHGIIPVTGEPIGPVEQYGSDRIFVYLRYDGALDSRLERLAKSGHPTLVFPVKDIYDLGAEIYRWEIATAVACAVLHVNAFDQPDVQDSKNRTAEKIKQLRQSGSLDEGRPIWQDETCRVYGEPIQGIEQARSLAEVVGLFVISYHKGDFVALNTYLPRNEVNIHRLNRIRAWLRRDSGLATTVGFGPRFLHSTGQLHKGGSNEGLFIQITADPHHDIPIPGEGITFGQLERAQALGDLEALRARGRRVMRVHLTDGDLRKLI